MAADGIRWLLGGSAPPVPTAEPDSHDATTAVDMKAELKWLRQRNEELQSQVEKLLLNASSQEKIACNDAGSAPSSCSIDDGLYLPKQHMTKRPRPNSITTDDNIHSGGGLHHRRSIGLSPTNALDGVAISSDEPGFKKKHTKYNRSHEKSKIAVVGDLHSPITAMSIDRGDEEVGRLTGTHVHREDASSSYQHDDDDGTDEEPENDDASHNKHLIKSKKHASRRTQPDSPTNSAFPPFMEQLKDRAGWLIGLLILQSCSSFIIQYNERFLQNHMIIVQFLTMLVGAGGNAGNQASVRVIRSLAVGTLNKRTMSSFLRSEAKMALSLSILIGMTGFIRAAMFRTPPGETIAVTASVCAIVAISVAIGSTLPLGMRRVGIDPAHSSTSIQVVMDILGVLITVCVSTFVMSFKVFQNHEVTREDDNLFSNDDASKN